VKLSKRQQEIATERRAQVGLPVLVCPNCGRQEAHWVPDLLDQWGRVVAGHYTCGELS
jgi:hypothetical protein